MMLSPLPATPLLLPADQAVASAVPGFADFMAMLAVPTAAAPPSLPQSDIDGQSVAVLEAPADASEDLATPLAAGQSTAAQVMLIAPPNSALPVGTGKVDLPPDTTSQRRASPPPPATIPAVAAPPVPPDVPLVWREARAGKQFSIMPSLSAPNRAQGERSARCVIEVDISVRADAPAASSVSSLPALLAAPAADMGGMGHPAVASATPLDARVDPGTVVVPDNARLSDSGGLARHLDVAGNALWLDGLAREIAGAATETGRLRFAVEPEWLGRLELDLHREAGGTNVRMAAANEVARDTLAAAQPRLIEELRTHGVRVSGFELAARTSDGETSGGGKHRAHPPHIDAALPMTAAVADVPCPTPFAAPGRFA